MMQTVGRNTIQQISRISKCFLGLNPETTKNLIITVLQARILYGSIVWLTLDAAKQFIKIWNVFLNASNRLILGAFRTSPVNRPDSFLIPFQLVAARLHYNFICKRLTALDSHPTKRCILYKLTSSPRSHHSCITRRIEPDLFQHIFLEIMRQSTHMQNRLGVRRLAKSSTYPLHETK